MAVPTARGPVTRRATVEVVDGSARSRPDQVVTEEPMEIRLGWPGHDEVPVVVTMRTPGADFELAVGFLLSEGILDPAEPPSTVAYCTDRSLLPAERYNVVTVRLSAPPRRHPGGRTTTMSAACGVCGTESLDAIFTPESEPIRTMAEVPADVVAAAPEQLRSAQRVFDRTGSLHAAGVLTAAGQLVAVREDVGRHNAVDKVLGAATLGTVELPADRLLCVSGRLGFDVMSKAVVGGFGVVVAVGGPSSLALELADRAGITVCAFTRGSRFVVYTHPERIGGV
jgi:FdhD protein